MKKELLQRANELQDEIDKLRESYETVFRSSNPAGCFIHIPDDLFLQQTVSKAIWDRIEQLEKDFDEL